MKLNGKEKTTSTDFNSSHTQWKQIDIRYKFAVCTHAYAAAQLWCWLSSCASSYTRALARKDLSINYRIRRRDLDLSMNDH